MALPADWISPEENAVALAICQRANHGNEHKQVKILFLVHVFSNKEWARVTE